MEMFKCWDNPKIDLLVSHWFGVLIKERQVKPTTVELSSLASRLKSTIHLQSMYRLPSL